MCERVCVEAERGRREDEAEQTRDTGSKTRTPHKDVGNDFQESHSHHQRSKINFPKILFSTKTSSNSIVIIPDILASCSFPANTKKHDLYPVRRRDLVKSASYLFVNSRVKYSMHSSPNKVSAYRVYPYTFIPPPCCDVANTLSMQYVSACPEELPQRVLSRPLHQKYIYIVVEFNQIASLFRSSCSGIQKY